MDKNQKLLLGVVGLGIVGYLLYSRRAGASTLPAAPPAPAPGTLVAPPAAGGGLPSPSVEAFRDPATGATLVGPSTPIAAPAAGTPDTIRTVERDESWTNLASRAYGDYRWWPYLWDHNRALSNSFGNPDLIRRGDQIRIPASPPSNAQYKAAVFARAEAHRRYWQGRQRGQRGPMPAIVTQRTPLPV
jgi:nucleoid-associated protein YgaU